jgi:hypothetical protein
MLAVLALWAYFALRDRPAAYYLSLFFACSLLTFMAEPAASLLLRLYRWRLGLFSDYRRDVIVGSLVIAFGLDPLLGVLFARYAATRPVLKALVIPLFLGGFEIWLEHHGYMHYTGWHSVFSVLAFVGYFLIVWRLTLREWPLPHWLHVLGFIVWQLNFSDAILQGRLELWHFHVRSWDWERLLSLMIRTLVVAPAGTWIAVGRLTHRLLWGGALLTVQLATVFLLHAVGLLTFRWVGLIAGLTVDCVILWLTVWYSGWLCRHEPAQAPPPWEPPVQLR